MHPSDFGSGNGFLNITQKNTKAHNKTEKIIKIKIFLNQMKKIKKSKNNPQIEEIFANYISHMRIISRIYKEYLLK